MALVEMGNTHRLNVLHSPCSTASDTTLFFTHGSMGSLTQFNDLIAAFTGRVNIVAFDTMGCGDSEKPNVHTVYSTDSLTSNLIEIFDKYSTKNNILVGHSYGTAQVARLCSHVKMRQLDSLHQKSDVTISGVVLLGTVDTLPKGGCSAFSIFSLPLCVLNPMQGWMTKSYVNMAFSTHSSTALKARATALAGNFYDY